MGLVRGLDIEARRSGEGVGAFVYSRVYRDEGIYKII